MKKIRLKPLIIGGLSLLLLINLGVNLPNLANAQRKENSHVTRIRKNRPHYHQVKRRQRRRNRKAKRVKVVKRHPNNFVLNNHNYGFDENYKRDVHTEKKAYPTYHVVSGNDRVRFNQLIYLNYLKYVKRNGRYHNGDPQSMVILPNGHLYVLFNVSHHNGHVNQIFEYNVATGRLIKIGRKFNGGHGQGFSYDYRTHRLWLCMNLYRYKGSPRGVIPKDMDLKQINQNSLQPYGHLAQIKSHEQLGDDLAYDALGNSWNVSRSSHRHDKTKPFGSLQVYQGRNGNFRLVKDLLHSPGACIQNLAYNPDTDRLYVIGNGVIMSFPINRINRLSNRDIKVAIMNRHSEFEGMGFWHRRAYLLVHPNQILRSNKLF